MSSSSSVGNSSSSSNWVSADSVYEVPQRSGDHALSTSGPATGGRTRVFHVDFSTADATEDQAIGASGIPAMWSDHPANGAYKLSSKRGEQQRECPTKWIVTCSYTLPAPGQNQESGGSGKWNIQISGSLVPREEETFVDTLKKAIKNSAGQQFQPSLKRVLYDERITCSYDTSAPAWTTYDACKGRANDAEITLTINGSTRTFATNTLKLENIEWSATVDSSGVIATRVSLHFLYRPSNLISSVEWGTWTTHVVDMGYLYVTDSGATVPVVDSNNNAVQTLTYLDGTGKKLAAGADVVKVDFTMIPTTSFTTLLAGVGT